MTEQEDRSKRLARLREYLSRDPENDNLRAEVFDAALSAGDLQGARTEAAVALERDPDHAGWRHREAMVLMASGLHAEAQRTLEVLLAGGHDAPAVRYNLAFAVFSQGHLEAAVEVLTPLLDAVPDETGLAWALWLRCQHRLRRSEAGLAAFRASLSRIPMPAEALGVASLMAADGEWLDEARTWSTLCLQHQPEQLEALATQGTVALAAQDAKRALEWFREALRVHPTDGRCWSGVAMARMLAADIPGADAAFAKAVQAMPDHIGTWIAWGVCHLLRNALPKALDCFQEALRLDPNFGESHGVYAIALARSGKVEEARREADIAARLDPGGLGARVASALLSGKQEDEAAFLRLASRLLASAGAGAEAPARGGPVSKARGAAS